MKLKSLPKIERPCEKLISKGAQNLKDLPCRELACPVGNLFSFRVLLRGEELLAIKIVRNC